MANIALDSPSPYTITYTISQMTPEYVYTATIELRKHNQQTILKRAVHRHVDTSHLETLFGYFTDLEPQTSYDIHSEIYREDGQETSDRTATLSTIAEWKGTLNTKIHSINIATKDAVYNTFENWGLVPAIQPDVTPPELKSEYVELPASDGVLDYTELLLGKVPFGRRTGSWRFYTDEFKMKSLGLEWQTLYEMLMQTIHGVKVEVSLDDDPDFYYTGRLNVNQWRSLQAFSEITIDYNFDSYKYSRTKSDEVEWQWDDVLDDPSQEILYGDYAVQEYKAITFINDGGQPTTPEISSTNDVVVRADIGDVVQQVIRGEWGYGQDRYDRLATAGYCWQYVQNQVNEALGVSARYEIPASAMTQKTEEGIADGTLSSGSDYMVIQGNTFNNNLAIRPGSSTMVYKGTADVHMQYQENEV